MFTAWLTASTAIVVAIVTGSISYLTSRRLHRKQSELARVDRQLSELYGPLYALSRSSDFSWVTFRQNHGADRLAYFDVEADVSPDEIESWCEWMTHVFMPVNRKMQEILLSKTELLISDDLPESLIALCSHVAEYEMILARWASGNRDVLTATNNHPGRQLSEYAQTSYQFLRARQRTLLRGTRRR